jgi:hypothetical protein
MKKLLFTMVLGLGILTANAQIQKLAGPRIGITMVTPGLLANILKKDVSFFSDENRESWDGTSLGEYGAVMSQYGWQWESRFADGGQVTGIVEWIALVGGMEKGMFLPSVSSMVGVRTASGVEFAVGPNLSLGGIAMVFGAGYNFKFGKLNLPVNIAYVPSMNKTYDHDADIDYDWIEGTSGPDGIWGNSDDIPGFEIETLISPKYSVTHPTGARISIMVGFNLSK